MGPLPSTPQSIKKIEKEGIERRNEMKNILKI
jgi:hypothetical protein